MHSPQCKVYLHSMANKVIIIHADDTMRKTTLLVFRIVSPSEDMGHQQAERVSELPQSITATRVVKR